MSKYDHKQVNITITEEQVDFLKANHGKMNISSLSKMLGLTYNKTHNNLKLLGLYKPKQEQGVIVNMQDFFDVDKFAKYYEY